MHAWLPILLYVYETPSLQRQWPRPRHAVHVEVID